MGIRRTFSDKDVTRYFDQSVGKVEKEIVLRLQYLGEQCLTEARENKTYMDQTGNLAASIGYVVLANGKAITTAGFQTAGGLQSGESGQLFGKQLAMKLSNNFKSGFVLIVVAGMDYAYYVEAVHGRNVLTSAELLAKREIPKLISKLTKSQG